MEIDKYISGLRNKNIIVLVQDDHIVVNAPEESITPEIVEQLTAKKEEVLSFLKSISNVEEFKSIKRAPVLDYYPLSSAQKRMYFLYEFDKNGVSYNMPAFYRIGRSLDIAKFEKAIRDLVKRHQSLRTLFSVQNDHPIQRVIDATKFEVIYKKIHSKDIDRSVSNFVRPFDLSEEFPYRVTLVEVIGDDYLLMIDSHHIINDGVSNEVLMSDLWSLYDGDVLPALDIQYIDYAAWQQSTSYQDIVAQHKKYWLDCFRDDLTTLELPTDYSRPIHLSNKGGVYLFTLSKTQSDHLRSIANQNGVTMFTLFLAIYNVLLSKLSNQEDIIVGTATAGRHHSDLEGIVGMFVNTLALRNKADSKMSFKDFLIEVQESTLTAFDHQLFQYEELVETLNLSRDAGRNPLFDVFFSYEPRVKGLDVQNSEVNVTAHEVSSNISKFDLSLEVLDSEEISLSFTYRRDLFDASSIERFMGYLNQIIKEVLISTTQELGKIDILSKEERTRLLIDFNNTETDYDLDQTVLDIFMSQSLSTPDAVAIAFGDERLCYKELNARSDQWAKHLINTGVKSGDIVGLMMTRSVEMVVAIIAVMKAGGAYLPINIDQPISRTEYMLNDCGVKIIMSNASIQLEDTKRYTLIDVQFLDKAINSHQKLPYVNALDLAYVIYTSGSTGQPKGVLIEHESLSNLIYHERDFLEIERSDNILQFSPYYFDVSVEQIWSSLCSGASLVLIDKATLTDYNHFYDYLKIQAITHLNVTPTFLERLSLPPLKNLKRILVSGEACKLSLAKRYAEEYDFYNEYGPTESTVISISQKLRAEHLINDKVPIGRPIANTQAYILSNGLELLPQGVSGELYLGGKGLAQGYLNRQDLTDKSFISNPFGEGRIYKTGDQARWLSDGTIEYLGRNDDQIKLRGYRIELGEIEYHLENSDFINRAVVVVSGSGDTKKLIAYICGEEEVEEAKVRSLLSSKVPDYMIPVAFIWMDVFPMNANGKIDKNALPSPDLTKGEIYVAPENNNHEKLVSIWSKVLGIAEEKISITSDFFKLGGHSLLAITLINKISKAFNVDILIRDFFMNRTIAELSFHISNMDQVTFSAIPKAPNSDFYPLSSAQRRMYFLYEFDKDEVGYNMPSFFKVSGTLDIDRLDAAFRSLLLRHQSLRTIFEIVDNIPVQRILDTSRFKINYHRGNPSVVEEHVTKFVRPFNLSKELPIRVSLMEVAEEDYLLMMDMHHIVNDGVSFDILMRDLWKLYHGEVLTDLSIHYVDYAVWQQSEAQQELVSIHKKYWMDVFSEEITTLELPKNRSKIQPRNNQGESYSIKLDHVRSDKLRSIANQEGSDNVYFISGNL